jgi:regulation of enolase protein 1 (concanavalin A-like superfamily)
MITMEGTWGSWSWSALPDPAVYGWTNVVYQMHEYQWNSTNDPAGVMAGTDRQVNDFRAHQSWNVPCLIGEFNDFGPGATPSAVWNYTVQQYQRNNMSWTEWSYKSSRGSSPDSWGIYDPTRFPPTPNLLTDSAATIQSDWSQWTTANAFAINPLLRSALNVTVRNSFSDADVGEPGAPGAASYDATSGQWTVRGGGSDIWNSADQFNFASQNLSGDGSVVARVIAVQDTDPWAKAGVMIRDGSGPAAAFADVVVTPGNGVAFHWRTSAGASATGDAPVTGLSAPVWVKLTRSGDTFTASYSADGATWTQIGGPQTIALSGAARAGLAVTAHNTGLLNTATFSNVSVLPANWTDADVGPPALPGSALFDGQTWTVSGGGSDIWNTADQFHFVSHSVTGDGTLVARVTALQSTDPWAKAGVMFRDGSGPGAAFAAVYATPGNGVAFQWRTSTGASATGSAPAAGLSAPVWVKLSRSGASFSAYYSADGAHWVQIGGPQTIAMSPTALAGLAVTAHNNSLLTTATFTVPTPATVTAVVVNGGAAQRSMVTAITVTFSQLVTLPADPAAAFRLTRTGPGGPAGDVALAADLSGSTATQTVVRLTFAGPLTEFGSLIDGRYTFTIQSSQVSGPGGPLDGDNDGTPGGDSVTGLFRLFGDSDGNGTVDALDLFRLRTTFGKTAADPGFLAYFDFDGSGAVDALDLLRFRTRFGTVLP